MNVLSIIEVSLGLLKGVSSTFDQTGIVGLAAEEIQAAIVALEKVHGSDITRKQLEDLRCEPEW